jgi:cellulose synthase/poly-beta-1,6-N-acetylglucosamine synthase-like glycosyltransferase
MSWGVIVFVLSAAFVFYVMAGYPLLVALIAKLFPAPEVQARPAYRSVSVLIPVHNGERWIRRKLNSLLSMDYPREMLEIIIISDGSTDGTEAIVSEFADRNVVLVSVPKGGKPAALNAGMERATGDIIFFTDVRQDVDPICLKCLVECLEDSTVGAVSGQHVILSGETNEEESVGLYWRFEWWVRGQLNRATSMLVVTGCVYAMRRNMVKPIPTDLLIDDCYLPVGALLKGYRIFWDERAKVYDFPTALDAEFSRKARSLAGLIQLVGYYPRLLLPVYRQWWHFLSYKLSRLLLPYALLVVFASSFALPGLLRWIVLVPQVIFYGLAALDPLIPEKFLLKRASALSRTFVVLMLATVAAGRVFFVPATQLWKPTTNVRRAVSSPRKMSA